jgi:molybdenum cofactor cytidylyltransferase
MAEIAAIILAAGRSSRYRDAGGREPSKLLATLGGKPLVRRAAEAALESRARPVIAVVGHEAERVAQALEGLPVRVVVNEAFATGMASSLKCGIAAVPPSAAGALVLLGDMPLVGAQLLDALIAAFARSPGTLAAVPTFDGRRGNPALLARELFAAVETLEGDEGARGLINAARLGAVVEAPAGDAAAILDVDTPQAMDAARRAMRP